jgi:hypothetical protein
MQSSPGVGLDADKGPTAQYSAKKRWSGRMAKYLVILRANLHSKDDNTGGGKNYETTINCDPNDLQAHIKMESDDLLRDVHKFIADNNLRAYGTVDLVQVVPL